MEIAFATVNLMGHLKPMMPYIGEMLARGHHVTVFCGSEPKFAEELKKEGLGAAAVVGAQMPNFEDMKKVGILNHLSRGGPMAVSCGPLFESIVGHYQRAPPAVIVADFFATAAMDAGDYLGVPVVVAFPNPLSMTSLPPPEQQSCWDACIRAPLGTIAAAILLRITRAMRNRERRSRAASSSLPPLVQQDIFPSAEQRRPMICTTGPPFEYNIPQSALLHFVGPAAPGTFAPLGNDLAQWVGAQQHGIVYIAFGTMNAFTGPELAVLCEQLKRLPAGTPVLWSLPNEQQKLLPPGPLPAAWRFEHFTPQWAVLQHPKIPLFVTHCGGNSTYEAILNEVSMVCCPRGADQFATAARVKAAGLGVVVRRGVRGDVAEAIATVLGDLPAFSARAKSLKTAMQAHGGAVRAAEILEAVAAQAHGEQCIPTAPADCEPPRPLLSSSDRRELVS